MPLRQHRTDDVVEHPHGDDGKAEVAAAALRRFGAMRAQDRAGDVEHRMQAREGGSDRALRRLRRDRCRPGGKFDQQLVRSGALGR